MFPATFEYYAPGTVKEAIALLSQHKDAKVIAGGHSLIPAMKLRLAQPTALVDIGRIPELVGIKVGADGTTIGALTTHARIALSEEIRARCPALPEAAALIGDRQVRNRGTIGGSLVHADPAADYPAVMVALGAEMKVEGPGGVRTIKAGDFFKGLMTSAVEPDEILTEIHIPPPQPHSGCAYVKFPNPASRFAIVGVCAWLSLDDKGACAKASIGVTGACATATRARSTEADLQGKFLDDASIASATAKAADGMDCLSDIHASAEYRAHLVKVFTEKAVKAAAARAR